MAVQVRIVYRKGDGIPDHITTIPDGTLNEYARAAARLLYADVAECRFHLFAHRGGDTCIRALSTRRDACAILGPIMIRLPERITPYKGVTLAELTDRLSAVQKREREQDAAVYASAAKRLRLLAEKDPAALSVLNDVLAKMVKRIPERARARHGKAVA